MFNTNNSYKNKLIIALISSLLFLTFFISLFIPSFALTITSDITNEDQTIVDETNEIEDDLKAKAGRIIFLNYHDIVELEMPDDIDPTYTTTAQKLESDINTLYDMGFESLNCEKYYYEDYEFDKDYFIMTFDDGYISNYTILPAILDKCDAYADIFMCTENTTLSNHFTYSQAKTMELSGRIKIYSHYTYHCYTPEIDTHKFTINAELSYKYIENRLKNERLRIFAYPHGAYTKETAEILKENGTVMQMVQSLPNDWDYDEYGMICRVNIEYGSDIRNVVNDYFKTKDALQ